MALQATGLKALPRCMAGVSHFLSVLTLLESHVITKQR